MIFCHFHSHEISFSIPSLSNLYISFAPRWVSRRKHIVGSCFLCSLPLYVFWLEHSVHWHLNVDKYVFLAILKLVFQLILCFSFFTFFYSFLFFFFFWLVGCFSFISCYVLLFLVLANAFLGFCGCPVFQVS